MKKLEKNWKTTKKIEKHVNREKNLFLQAKKGKIYNFIFHGY